MVKSKLSNVRVTYSGLVAFVTGLISVLTGLVFTLIVTRTLSPEEFGTWSVIGTLIIYLLVSESVISFFTTRQLARGDDVGKTSLISSSIFSVGILPIYLVVVYFLAGQSNAHLHSMILGVMLVPVYYVSQTLVGINLSHKPQSVSYGLLIFEIGKIPAALFLVNLLEWGLDGAIIAVTIAYILRVLIQLYFAKPKLVNSFNVNYLKRWIRLSWVAVYSTSTRLSESLDIVIYPIITGSVIGVAFFSVSLTIASLVVHSSLIAQALAPKLLSKGNLDHIPNTLTLTLYFAIPLLGISMLFSKAGLFALNPLYESAYLIAILLSVKTFFFVLVQIFRSILQSLDTADVENKPRFTTLLQSKLFLIPSGRYIHSFLYLASLSVILVFLHSSNTDELEIVTWWSILSVSFEIPFFIFMMFLLKRSVQFSISLFSIMKYVFATVIFSIIFMLTSDYIINYKLSIFEYLPSLFLELLLCIVVYFGITFLIDLKTRNLITTIIHEIKNK